MLFGNILYNMVFVYILCNSRASHFTHTNKQTTKDTNITTAISHVSVNATSATRHCVMCEGKHIHKPLQESHRTLAEQIYAAVLLLGAHSITSRVCIMCVLLREQVFLGQSVKIKSGQSVL